MMTNLYYYLGILFISHLGKDHIALPIDTQLTTFQCRRLLFILSVLHVLFKKRSHLNYEYFGAAILLQTLTIQSDSP